MRKINDKCVIQNPISEIKTDEVVAVKERENQMRVIYFIVFTIAYLVCLKVMKKIEPDNWFYKWYATVIWILYSTFVFLS